MAISPEEQAQRERFSEFYARAQLPTMRSLEPSVCGCDYGGTSWTTQDEAERMGALLGAASGSPSSARSSVHWREDYCGARFSM